MYAGELQKGALVMEIVKLRVWVGGSITDAPLNFNQVITNLSACMMTKWCCDFSESVICDSW